MADWGGPRALSGPAASGLTYQLPATGVAGVRETTDTIRYSRQPSDEDIAIQLRAAFHDVRIEDLKPISPAIHRDWLRVAQRARGLF